MTLFLLSIGCISREFSDTLIPYVGCRSIFIDDFKFYRDFVFADDLWIINDSVFDISMRQPWLYFCYRFDASVLNSLTLSITYIGYHSVLIGDFKVYSYSVFAGDLWISRDIMFLTISCITHNSIFAIDYHVEQGLCFRWRFRIHNDITFLTIPCVSHNSILAIDLMRRSWIQWRCRLHTSTVTQYLLTISRSTVTLFSPPICGSAVT